jgi:hypothetical protein
MNYTYADFNQILATALQLNLADMEGDDKSIYDQLSTMYGATQERAVQLSDELRANLVPFHYTPWNKEYTPDAVDYMAAILNQDTDYYKLMRLDDELALHF